MKRREMTFDRFAYICRSFRGVARALFALFCILIIRQNKAKILTKIRQLKKRKEKKKERKKGKKEKQN